MLIGGHDTSKNVLFVAEVGNNHEGDFDTAKRMIEAAATTGAQAVKFQTLRADKLVSRLQHERFEQLKRFELSEEHFAQLSTMARDLGLLFISTPLWVGAVELLRDLVCAFKIASGDNNYLALLTAVAQTGKPILLSTGMSDLKLLHQAVTCVRGNWQQAHIRGELGALHCVSGYPVPLEQANIRAVPLLREELDVAVGYSDHTLGIEACLGAIALGAEVIEKHFTLRKDLSSFRDHQLSATPSEMKELVERGRAVARALGSGQKEIADCERPTAAAARRSAVAARDLCRGERLAPVDIEWLRPGGGIEPSEEAAIFGRVLLRDIACGTPLSFADLE